MSVKAKSAGKNDTSFLLWYLCGKFHLSDRAPLRYSVQATIEQLVYLYSQPTTKGGNRLWVYSIQYLAS